MTSLNSRLNNLETKMRTVEQEDDPCDGRTDDQCFHFYLVQYQSAVSFADECDRRGTPSVFAKPIIDGCLEWLRSEAKRLGYKEVEKEKVEYINPEWRRINGVDTCTKPSSERRYKVLDFVKGDTL